MIFTLQIQIYIKFGTAKSINMYVKAKKNPHIKGRLNLKCIFIKFAATNLMLEYIFINC